MAADDFNFEAVVVELRGAIERVADRVDQRAENLTQKVDQSTTLLNEKIGHTDSGARQIAELVDTKLQGLSTAMEAWEKRAEAHQEQTAKLISSHKQEMDNRFKEVDQRIEPIENLRNRLIGAAIAIAFVGGGTAGLVVRMLGGLAGGG